MFSNNESNVWESISDLMTGLMMIFLFIGLAFLYDLQQTSAAAADLKQAIYSELVKEFPTRDLEKWGAVIDTKTMAVTFREPDVLFGVGQSTVQPRFQEILNDFFPRYIKVLQMPQFEGKIAEIRIEGYASLEAGENRDSDSDYFRNMEISQSRARNVLQYVFGIPSLADKKEWLRQTVITNGYSFGRASADSSSNAERRVEFRFITNDQQLLKEFEKFGIGVE